MTALRSSSFRLLSGRRAVPGASRAPPCGRAAPSSAVGRGRGPASPRRAGGRISGRSRGDLGGPPAGSLRGPQPPVEPEMAAVAAGKWSPGPEVARSILGLLPWSASVIAAAHPPRSPLRPSVTPAPTESARASSDCQRCAFLKSNDTNLNYSLLYTVYSAEQMYANSQINYMNQVKLLDKIQFT